MIHIKMPIPRLNENTGFTLIEILVSMVIGLVVLAGVATTFTVHTRQNTAEEQIAQMQQNVRAALDLMVREIQMAKYDPLGSAFPTGTYGVTYNATQLQIQADMDGSGALSTTTCDPANSASMENIIYAWDSANLRITRRCGSGGTAEVLADNIPAFNFSYYDANGTAVNSSANSGNIRKVTIDITARTAKPDPSYTSNGGYRTYQLSADITPSNLGL
jgi:type IV pilus assembly protein PilW